MRRRKKPGSKEKLLSHQLYLCEEPEKYKGHWNNCFDEKKPIHVELGIGRGQFITTLAELNPDIHYIGIEIKEEILLKAVEKAETKKLKNIKFLWYDVNKINDIFNQGELSRIYINFCDPWPKKRWEKRRLTHRSFLEKYKYILTENGEIHFKTDNEKLFEFSLNEFSYAGLRLNNITFDLHHGETKDPVTTEYEDKFSAMGMKIYRCEGFKEN
ncbi:tRNA (guanine-N(7)-)-methyltransferase [Anaerovirgula multivorans]|uniref:tRNA (guanine-N(7)-)-methyltransferase n=1 Tax=Anaerovirgula multivorans TaxID=312168 RepID=A0A239HW01_9FIRM|nr:tRNA (guanosine(46)-N7)-methyltransferase TrmB [Anaerovirgula multivorans]SNS85452.1 tRNA (guanine-N(7)-)-methyltransferase [Anaerovirgula multivorans]